MLAFLGNFGPLELVLIGIVAVLVFGKNLPQAASKAYLQVRKLRNAVDDLRRDSGIEREIRNIERTVREAEWEARRKEAPASPPVVQAQPSVPRQALPAVETEGAAPSDAPLQDASPDAGDTPATAPDEGRGATPTDAAS